jgi:putative SOS response-associated peptidase YedK
VILTDKGAERWLSDAKFEDLKDLLHCFESPSLLNHPVDKKGRNTTLCKNNALTFVSVGSTRFQSEECSKKVDIKFAGMSF